MLYLKQGNQKEISPVEKIVGCEVHPFSRTLGPGPYKFVGFGRIAFSSTFGHKYMGPEIEKGCGTCAHCGTAIMNIYVVETSEKRKFGVGCDCIMEVANQAGFENIPEVERMMRKLKNEQAKAARERRKLKLRRELIDLAEANKEKLLKLNSTNSHGAYVSSYYANAYDCIQRTSGSEKYPHSIEVYKRSLAKAARWLALEVT
jgi:hypothetical protein